MPALSLIFRSLFHITAQKSILTSNYFLFSSSYSIPAALEERTVPGQLGQLCSISESSESSSTTPQKCDQGLSCIPMPRLVNSTAPEDNPLYDAGFCATRPSGTTFGVFPFLQTVDAPQPVAFFPLTGGVFSALTLPEYSSTAVLGESNLTWVSDPMFDTVPVCNRSAMNAIQLDNVPYGAFGPFTVNLWMRRLPGISNLKGNAFQYLFSHAAFNSEPGYSANQVHLYLPEQDHPAYGTVRAIVKDSNDDPWELGFLDSDGEIKSSAERAEGPAHDDINDGSWHMISLTTLPNNEESGDGGRGAEGYVLYVNGQESGKISQPTPLADGSTAMPTGGDPALMSHDIFLCSRSDLGNSNDTARYYDGALANLMLFDTALTAEQVQALYKTYNPGKYSVSGSEGEVEGVFLASEKSAEALEAKDAGERSASSGDGGSGGLSAGAITGIVFAAIAATVGLVVLGTLAVGAVRNRRRGGGGGGGGGIGGKFERFEENRFSTAAPVSPSYAEGGYGSYPSFTSNNSNGSSKYPSVPTNTIPPSNIQLSSSGPLNQNPSGTLMSEASLPVQPSPSAPGLHHVHVRTAGNSAGGGGAAVGSPASGVAVSGNPFGGGGGGVAAPTAASGLPPASPSASLGGAPTTPRSPTGTEFSGASGSTMTDDVDIQPGKRTISGKKSSTRIVLPSE